MYNFSMSNKTTNIFRFKVKKSKQPSIHIDKAESDKQEGTESFSKNRPGFSYQYISLAKKFNIKLLPEHSLGDIKKRKEIQSLNLKSKELRIKTQFSKTKSRYHIWQSPLNLPEGKHYSFWINQKSGELSSRREKQALVKLNKNTVYNDMFFRLKTEEDTGLIIEQRMVKLTIKKGDQILTNLGRHCQKLLAIKQAIQRKQSNQNDIIREIKLYVLRQESASISKLDNYFNEDKLRKQIKQLIIMQRMALLAIVTNILSHHFIELIQQASRIVELILGFWYQVLNHTYSQNIFQLQIQQNSPIKVILQNLSQEKLLTKRNIKLLLQTAAQKLSILFKHFKGFYKQISFLTNYSHELTINRAFYQLLTIYASFVTLYENNHKIVLDNVSFFATCPSPYLVKSNPKQYTLVVDLDQTLLYCASSNNKQKNKQKPEVQLRPGALQFITQLSQFYQIIVFTTALQSYARQATQDIKGIDYYLFRQHAVRVKSGFVKDLSRLGRNLNKVIIVDDTPNNFKFQKDNAIKVGSWKGEFDDNELFQVKELLLKLVQAKPENVTTFLKEQKAQGSKKCDKSPQQKVQKSKNTQTLETPKITEIMSQPLQNENV